jgi:DNA invertase Pin-like site-specific DNA recombinase
VFSQKEMVELAPANRAERQPCSDPCRVPAYRARQEQARELASAGKTAREIAKELGSTVDTVKKWINKGR